MRHARLRFGEARASQAGASQASASQASASRAHASQASASRVSASQAVASQVRASQARSACGRVAAFAVAVFALACAPAPSGGPVVRGADELRQVATQITASGTNLSLAVEAWRSFQPIVGNAGDPLTAILRIHAAQSEGVPGALSLATVYLVHGADVVQLEAREEEARASNASTVEFVLRDGPRWASGDSIDVIAEVSGLGGANVLLRAPRVAIARVD